MPVRHATDERTGKTYSGMPKYPECTKETDKDEMDFGSKPLTIMQCVPAVNSIRPLYSTQLYSRMRRCATRMIVTNTRIVAQRHAKSNKKHA